MSNKTRFSRYIKGLHTIADLFILNVSFWLVAVFYGIHLNALAEQPFGNLLLFYNLLWLLLVVFNQPYNVPRIKATLYAGFYLPVLTTVLLHGLVAMACLLVFQLPVPLEVALSTHLVHICITLGWKSLFSGFVSWYRIRGFNRRNIIILGKGELANDVEFFFGKNPKLGYHLKDVEQPGKEPGEAYFAFLRKFATQQNLHEIYCCVQEKSPDFVERLLLFGDRNNIKIKLVTDFRGFVTKGIDLEYLGYIPVLKISRKSFENYRLRTVKRVFDVTVSATFLITFSPLYLLLALITLFASKGPVFYKQERIGKWGKPFTIYKFRSMRVDAESNGPQLACNGDPRVTLWGRFMRKTRLDELPQLYNVLIGDMSVVGPRPERQCFVDEIVKIAPHYRRLHLVKPGVTSIGQIMFGYAENVEEMVKRLRYDILYLNNISLAVDFKLMLMTVLVMVQGKGK